MAITNEKRWGGGKYTKAGLPDMHIVVKGVSVEVELKAPNGRLSELQKQKLKQIDESGCIAVVLYPKYFEYFKDMVRLIKKYNLVDVDFVSLNGLDRGWTDA